MLSGHDCVRMPCRLTASVAHGPHASGYGQPDCPGGGPVTYLLDPWLVEQTLAGASDRAEAWALLIRDAAGAVLAEVAARRLVPVGKPMVRCAVTPTGLGVFRRTLSARVMTTAAPGR